MPSSNHSPGTAWAFEQYEAVRYVLPQTEFPASSKIARNLSEVGDSIDTFLLDAFGVLNVGDTAIPGAVERMAALRVAGKRLLVVSNSASFPTPVSAEKYRSLGFDFTDDEVVSSRDALKVRLQTQPPILWGVAGMRSSELEELGVDAVLLEDDPKLYQRAEGFILLSAGEWNDARQTLLVEAIAQDMRPVFVGNPDIVAPRENDLSLEPGFYAHDLAEKTGCAPVFYGKPFSNIYELARDRLGTVDPGRTAMVGDTLHTDVLGGAAAGFKTILIEDHGLFAGSSVAPYIAESGIVPSIRCATT